MKYFIQIAKCVLIVVGMLFMQLCKSPREPSISAQSLDPKPYAATVNKEDIEKHLSVLTSNEMRGRETGENGQKKAAQYLAKQFKALGLLPVASQDGEPSYFQRFMLSKIAWNQVYMEIHGKKYTHLKDMLYLSNGPKVSAEQFEVLLPQKTEGETLEGKLLAYSASSAREWQQKVALARKKGALGAVVFVDSNDFGGQVQSYRPYLDARYLRTEEVDKEEMEFALVLPASAFRFFFGVKLARAEEAVLSRAQITCKADTRTQEIETENVVGYIKGHTKEDELLVITAHYDHLGVRGRDIYRGADDNGSGTSALLEIAEAFSIAKAEGNGPLRSILFIAMTGEEKGLLGSEYYTKNPIFPLSQTVANLNVDMIGRVDAEHKGDPNYVYIIGSDRLSTELHQISEQTNRRYTQLKLDYTFNDEDDPNRFYYRSDHYNFAKNGIPVIFYFSGVHEDYHRPSDTIDKILFDKCTRIAQLIFHTAWEVANQPERPKVDKK